MPELVNIVCSVHGCHKSIKDNRWSKTKNDDWFHQRDDTSYCPEHVPSWVAEWREKKADRK